MRDGFGFGDPALTQTAPVEQGRLDLSRPCCNLRSMLPAQNADCAGRRPEDPEPDRTHLVQRRLEVKTHWREAQYHLGDAPTGSLEAARLRAERCWTRANSLPVAD